MRHLKKFIAGIVTVLVMMVATVSDPTLVSKFTKLFSEAEKVEGEAATPPSADNDARVSASNKVVDYFQALQQAYVQKSPGEREHRQSQKSINCRMDPDMAWDTWASMLSTDTTGANTYELFDRPQKCFNFEKILLPRRHPVNPDEEWIAVVRTQKTASKTVTAILKWLAADLHGGQGPDSKRDVCNSMFFGSSVVPTAFEVQHMQGVMSRYELFSNPYQARMDFARQRGIPNGQVDYWSAVSKSEYKDSTVLDNKFLRQKKDKGVPGLEPAALSNAPTSLLPTFNSDVIGEWYKGAELQKYEVSLKKMHGNQPPGCNGFDPPHKIVPDSAKCKYLYQQHMHVGDVFGAIWEMEGVKPENVRIVTAIRHPVRRTLSEYKHLGIRGKALWDYCHHPDFDDLGGAWKTGNAKFGTGDGGQNYFRQFMLNEFHAYGMRNRQTKMLSGLVTEPRVPSLPESRRVWKHIAEPLLDSEGQKQFTSFSENVSSAQPDAEYMRWGLAAFHQAQYQLTNSTGFLLLERLPESIAVLLYTLNWRPRIRVQKEQLCFPPSEITHKDPFLFADWSNITKSGCGNSISSDSNVPEEEVHQLKSATEDSARVIRGSEVDAVSPTSRAWRRLLHVSRQMGKALSSREGVDYQKIPFEVDRNLFNDILSVNHWDTALFYWTDKLLSARVSLVKEELAAMETKYSKKSE